MHRKKIKGGDLSPALPGTWEEWDLQKIMTREIAPKSEVQQIVDSAELFKPY